MDILFISFLLFLGALVLKMHLEAKNYLEVVKELKSLYERGGPDEIFKSRMILDVKKDRALLDLAAPTFFDFKLEGMTFAFWFIRSDKTIYAFAVKGEYVSECAKTFIVYYLEELGAVNINVDVTLAQVQTKLPWYKPWIIIEAKTSN